MSHLATIDNWRKNQKLAIGIAVVSPLLLLGIAISCDDSKNKSKPDQPDASNSQTDLDGQIAYDSTASIRGEDDASQQTADGHSSTDVDTKDSDAEQTKRPEVLVRRPGPKLGGIAVDSAYLYWTESGMLDKGVMAMPKQGGEVRRLGSHNMFIIEHIFVTDEDYVYWIERDHVNKVSKKDWRLEQIQLGADYYYGAMGGNENYLFVADGGCTKIARVNKTDGSLQVTEKPGLEDHGGATVVVADEQQVYCSSGGGGQIYVQATSGGEIRLLADREPGVSPGERRYIIGGVALTEDYIYIGWPPDVVLRESNT